MDGVVFDIIKSWMLNGLLMGDLELYDGDFFFLVVKLVLWWKFFLIFICIFIFGFIIWIINELEGFYCFMFIMVYEKNVFFGGFVFLDEVILCISVFFI